MSLPRRRVAALACVAIAAGAGCRLASTFTKAGPDAGGADAAGDGGPGADAAVDGGTDAAFDAGIAALGPFGAPVLLDPLSDPADDDDPSATADLLELYFNSNRAGGGSNGDIWVAKRSARTAPWEPPTLVVELSSMNDEKTPEVSADGLTIWFASDDGAGMGGDDIWVSARATRGGAWGMPVLVPELNSADDDRGPATSATSLLMVITTFRPGSSGADLWWTGRTTEANPWITPMLLAEPNTADGEFDAFPSPAGLHLYFGSDRPGSGGDDIWLASRPSAASAFGAPTPVTELNTTFNEGDVWLSADLRRIIFWSDRSGDNEIWEATR